MSTVAVPPLTPPPAGVVWPPVEPLALPDGLLELPPHAVSTTAAMAQLAKPRRRREVDFVKGVSSLIWPISAHYPQSGQTSHRRRSDEEVRSGSGQDHHLDRARGTGP
jgi:hypothetical protein